MKRWVIAAAVAVPLVTLTAAPAVAEVKTREKTAVKFEGMLGRMMGLFGGKAAREGIVSTTVVKGNRKATTTDQSGQIVDLAEEKIYDIDFRKKEYKVTTFAELRQRMKEAQERAQRDARESGEKGQAEEPGKPQKEFEVDFDLKDTGQKKQIAGHEARQVVMTITVREKGRSLEDSGGLVMTADSWLGPKIPAMKESTDFDMKYWKQLYGADMTISAEQMAAVLAMFPLVAKAQERMRQENVNLDGTPLATTTTFEAVKSKEQLAQESQQQQGGGIGDMLARRMKKGDAKPRATIFTMQHEMQEISTTAAAEDLQIPAGFKEKK